MASSADRIWALVVRQVYLHKRTFYRWLDIFYWPVVDLLLWGFLTLYLTQNPGSVPQAASFLIGALILWDILFRSQQSVTIGFLDDVWSHNLLNMWVSPIKPVEYVVGAIIVGVIRVAVGTTIVIGIAWLLFGFNFFGIGIALVPFVLALAAMGWAIGLVAAALILRFGQGVEELAWAIIFLVQPFAAVFYPMNVLPPVMQAIATLIPAAHVFEGMRSVITGHGLPVDQLVWAFGLDIIYLAGAWWLFDYLLRRVRELGLFSRFGE